MNAVQCPFCGLNTQPEPCGELTSSGPCQDLLCPLCGEEIFADDAAATSV